MPTPTDVLSNWITVGQIIGSFIAALIFGFVAVYRRARDGERERVERTSDVAATAVGAAIVDKSVADTFLEMAEDVGALRAIAERREKQEQDEDLVERVAERLRVDRDKERPR